MQVDNTPFIVALKILQKQDILKHLNNQGNRTFIVVLQHWPEFQPVCVNMI